MTKKVREKKFENFIQKNCLNLNVKTDVKNDLNNAAMAQVSKNSSQSSKPQTISYPLNRNPTLAL